MCVHMFLVQGGVVLQFEHLSSWPAFTETVQPDSVSKRPDEHNACKVGVAPPT